MPRKWIAIRAWFTYISKIQTDFTIYFTRVLLSPNFANAKFRENKTLAKISEFTVYKLMDLFASKQVFRNYHQILYFKDYLSFYAKKSIPSWLFQWFWNGLLFITATLSSLSVEGSNQPGTATVSFLWLVFWTRFKQAWHSNGEISLTCLLDEVQTSLTQQQCHLFVLSSGRGSNQPDTATVPSLCLVFWTRFKPAWHSNSVISLTCLLDEVQTSLTQQQCHLFDLSAGRGSNQPDTATVLSLWLVFSTRFKPAWHSNSVISLTCLLDEVQTSLTQQQFHLFDLSSERGSNQPDTATVSSLWLVFWTRLIPAWHSNSVISLTCLLNEVQTSLAQQQCYLFDLSSGRGSNLPDTATVSSLWLVCWMWFKPAWHSNSVISLTCLLDVVQTSLTQQQWDFFDLSSGRGSYQPHTATVSSLWLVFWTRFKPAWHSNSVISLTCILDEV